VLLAEQIHYEMYGTGQADVWEVFGNHGAVTDMSWNLGWRALEPLKTAQFQNASFEEYLTTTMGERSPRLLVIECPNKQWFQCTQNIPFKNNSARQKSKKIREVLNPFLSTAQWLVDTQLADGHDFLLETPFTQEVLRHPNIVKMTSEEDVHIARGEMGTWWLTSSHDIAKKLDNEHKTYHTRKNRISKKICKDVMMSFGHTLQRKEPDRIKQLVRAVDSRIRAAGV
jgi:hypothetical protein